MRGRGGFTLIEVMIAIAIFAIVAGTMVSARFGLHSLSREADYHAALNTAQRELARLKTAELAHEPPESGQAGADGWVQLHHSPVRDVQVLGGAAPLQVDEAKGRVRVGAGQTVRVAYSYAVSDAGEAHTVTQPQVALDHDPDAILSVSLAQGDKVAPLPGWKLSGRTLELPATAVGHVVVVDYRNRDNTTWVRGEELTDMQLHPRLFTVEQGYPGNQQLVLQTLRVKP